MKYEITRTKTGVVVRDEPGIFLKIYIMIEIICTVQVLLYQFFSYHLFCSVLCLNKGYC